jgi:hypothetical protein
MLSVKGIFKNGTALPLEKVEGYEDQPVIITFLTDSEAASEEEGDWDKLYQLIENCTINTGIMG